MADFTLKPPKKKLQQLAEEYWEKSSKKWRSAEKAAFAAGTAIRKGNFSLKNLVTILKWKSARSVFHLKKNSSDQIKDALKRVSSPKMSTSDAMNVLIDLKGVDVAVASAILTAIFPRRYTVLDFRTLEALGHPRHNVAFYEEYLTFCKTLARGDFITPQNNRPAPTALRALDRALWRWSKNMSIKPHQTRASIEEEEDGKD